MYRFLVFFFLINQISCRDYENTTFYQNLKNKYEILECEIASLNYSNQYNDSFKDKQLIYKREINYNSDRELNKLKEQFLPFLNTRSYSNDDKKNKQAIRNYILQKFSSYSLQPMTQTFTTKIKAGAKSGNVLTGINLIGLYQSKLRKESTLNDNELKNDNLLVIGSHYDTVINSPGIDDNASGVVAILEIAKMLFENNIQLNFSIMFVCFDLEEEGLLGSQAFVNEFLIPKELAVFETKFLGAYVLDMILSFDDAKNSQVMPKEVLMFFPETKKINQGNFIASFGRKNIDDELTQKLRKYWNKSNDKYKHLPLEIDLFKEKNGISPSRAGLYLRSDHANFWIHKYNSLNYKLNAILLTDLGPWRSKIKNCYHKFCDDQRFLTKENLSFFSNTIKVLYNIITKEPPNMSIKNKKSLRILNKLRWNN